MRRLSSTTPPFSELPTSEWIDPVIAIARETVPLILSYYEQSSPLEIETKSNSTPVTEADKHANEVIVAALEKLTPQIPIVSEEGDHPEFEEGAIFWLVDPIDGTRSFIAHDGEFSINIALVAECVPQLGVMLQPTTGLTYWGLRGTGAFRQRTVEAAVERIAVRTPPPLEEGYDVVGSKSFYSVMTDKWLQRYPVRNFIKAGSALKFARVAEGDADLYPRLSKTMEWDTAAGQAILEAAGGHVTDLLGAPLRYGKEGYHNATFVASGFALEW